jgi:hypothetical protein
MLFEMNWMEPQHGNGGAQEPGEGSESVPAGETAETKSSRLSGLRRMVDAEDLKELSQRKRIEGKVGGSETAEARETPIRALHEGSSRLSGLRGLVTPADLKELSQARTAAAFETAGEARGSQLKEAKTRGGETAAQGEEPAEAQASRPFLAATQGEGGQLSERSKAKDVPSKPPVRTTGEQRAEYEEVQILPSKRGQYRRKK